MGVIRWGILGCGDVTEVKSGPGFQKAVGSELVAVMRRDGEKAKDYARRHGVERWYDDADRLIGDSGVDAVYVATPPGTHEFYAMKVLAAGKPCYVEKPMARCASEARRMVEGFKAAGVPLFVAYYRRALPRFLKVKEILESRVLGELKFVNYVYADAQMQKELSPLPWRLVPEQAGGGLFLDLGSHALNLLDFLFGPLAGVSGIARRMGRETTVEDHIVMNFTAGQTQAMGVWNFFEDGKKLDWFYCRGEMGALSFSCFGNEPVILERHDKTSDLWERPNLTRETFDLPNPQHVAQPLIQTVVDNLLGAGKCPSIGESGLRTQEVMDAALLGYYGNRDDGFWKGDWPGRVGR